MAYINSNNFEAVRLRKLAKQLAKHKETCNKNRKKRKSRNKKK